MKAICRATLICAFETFAVLNGEKKLNLGKMALFLFLCLLGIEELFCKAFFDLYEITCSRWVSVAPCLRTLLYGSGRMKLGFPAEQPKCFIHSPQVHSNCPYTNGNYCLQFIVASITLN